MYTASLAMMYNAANSASVAEDMTCLMTCAIFRMAPLLGGMLALLDKKKCPSCSTSGFGFTEVAGIAVDCEDHVTFVVGENCIFLCCKIV